MSTPEVCLFGPNVRLPGFAYIFALALLAAGQSASLTVTLSGQIVSEGFLQWKTKPWKRRLITRSIGIVPS